MLLAAVHYVGVFQISFFKLTTRPAGQCQLHSGLVPWLSSVRSDRCTGLGFTFVPILLRSHPGLGRSQHLEGLGNVESLYFYPAAGRPYGPVDYQHCAVAHPGSAGWTGVHLIRH